MSVGMADHGLAIVQRYAERWRSLRAWRAALPLPTLKILPYNGQRRLGFASSLHNRATIYVTGILAEDLGTALHELAHLAAPSYSWHEQPWRELYVAAAVEAVGLSSDAIHEFELDVSIADLDAQVVSQIEDWVIDQEIQDYRGRGRR